VEHRRETSAAEPRRSALVLMAFAAVLGFMASIAIPHFIRSQARREVAQIRAQARTPVDIAPH
jgi:hypothetical protein